jgi:hypothetical protein
MKRNIKSLIGFTLSATDGEIGKVKEFYFDDETWTIRYLIVDTGNWLSGRVVLISPQALLAPDWENKTFPINLTREQIKNSPDINTDIPVSRREEMELHSYYPWVNYWAPGYFGGMGPLTDSSVLLEQRTEEQGEDKHLRSTHKVTGYTIQASDGKIGTVEDFLVDDSWKIDFILVDTDHWFPGRKILLSPDMIKEIDWATELVVVYTTVAHVRNSPEYDPKQALTEVYSLALHDHYRDLVSRN